LTVDPIRSTALNYRQLGVAALLAAGFAAAPAAAQSAANGQQLYESYCVVCHGSPPVGGPERAAGNPALIRNAINGGVPAMTFLRSVMTDADINDIAAYLLQLANPNQQPAVPAFDYTDLWWGGESESGWGLNLIQHPSNKLFAVMYTYEAPNRATWFVLPDGAWSSPFVYTGAIYRASGPALSNPAFNPALVRVSQLGLATLTFTDRNNGTFAFTIDGVRVTKTISRQPF
jgi:cytochrome c5